MENYYFDKNGLYSGSTPAHPGTIAPNNALRVPPEVKEGYWPVINADETGWELREDHRGKQGWVDGHATIVTELGSLPNGWTEEKPEETLTSDELRRQAYSSQADPLRDLALSYQLEAEACRKRGDTAGAIRATAKFNHQLDAFLATKKDIRNLYPNENDSTAEEETVNTPTLFFLSRSGVYHTGECGFSRGNGDWIEAEDLSTRGETVRPCRRCRPCLKTSSSEE